MTSRRIDETDKTGQKRFGKNLLSGWAVEFAVVISGFVTPRLIDANLGQTQLGIWDLAWSVVSYFRFLGLGLSGGLNRYVALHTAKGTDRLLDRFVSSTIALQIIVALLTIVITLVVAYYVPILLEQKLGNLVVSTRWVIVLLGATMAARMVAWPARGVLTGQHHWSVNAGINIAGDITGLLAMVAALMANGGLREIAGAYLLVTIVTELYRYVIARRYYGRPMFRVSDIKIRESRELLVFGIKTNVGGLPTLIVSQTLNIILAASMGPGALAIYARALALQRHTHVFVGKFTMLLTPTVASLQGLDRESEYKAFFIRSMRSSLALTLPLYLVLANFGDLLIRVWMGDDYVTPGLLSVICIGMLLPTAQSAAFRILVGLNEHGRAGLIALISTSVLLGVGVFFGNGIGWSPYLAASILGTSLTFGSAIPVTGYACSKFSVKFKEYASQVVFKPLLANIPFAVVLYGAPLLIDEHDLVAGVAQLILAIAVLALSYWFGILDEGQKLFVRARVSWMKPISSAAGK